MAVHPKVILPIFDLATVPEFLGVFCLCPSFVFVFSHVCVFVPSWDVVLMAIVFPRGVVTDFSLC